ncbi:MAG: tetratricopeptide repeat protein, partial [Bacteroidota bacterium]
MKRYLLLVYFLLIMPVCFAQQKHLDSLLIELKKHPAEDTSRLNILNLISFDYYSIDPAKGLQTGKEALTLALKIKDKVKLANSYNVLATNYKASGEPDSAMKMFKTALYHFEDADYKKGITGALSNIGVMYFQSSDYINALKYYKESMEMSQQTGNEYSEGVAMANIGMVYRALNDYPNALSYYLKALARSEKGNDNRGLMYGYFNIGELYRALFNLPKAKEYTEKAIAMSEKQGDLYTLSTAYQSIAQIYLDMNNLPEALKYVQKAISICDSSGLTAGKGLAYADMGRIYVKMNDYGTAINLFQKAAGLLEQINDKNNLSYTMQELSRAYSEAPDDVLIKLGIKPSEKFNKAIAIQEQTLKMAKELDSPERQVSALENLSYIYEKQKNFAKSLEMYKQSSELNKSIYSDENKKEITRKEMQFEFDKKEALLKADHDKKEALAAAEIKRQLVIKNSAVGGAAVLLFAGAIIFVLYKRRRDAEEQKKESDFKAEVSETEMKALRSQMNPHFIFNSLNSIGDYISRNDNKSAD